MHSYRKYLVLLSLSFQSLAEYRLDFSLGILTRSVSYLVLFFFWAFLAQSGADVRPYTIHTLALYYLLVGVIGAAVYFDSNALAREIREGDASMALLKPMRYLGYFFTASSSERISNFIVGMGVLGSVIILGLPVQIQPGNFALFLFVLFLAIIGNYLLYFIVGLFALWTQQIHGLSSIVSIASTLVSGSLIPIELLPNYLANLSYYLPFRYFSFLPIKILLNQSSAGESALGIGLSVFWVMALFLLYRIIWHFGIKKFESAGI